jgi:hypothetical protein|tara:strand:- start:880 stop:1071 length:192 start_codon:yes stop_codon:yes gene_type:complete
MRTKEEMKQNTYSYSIGCGSKSCDFQPPCFCRSAGALTVTSVGGIIDNAIGSNKIRRKIRKQT